MQTHSEGRLTRLNHSVHTPLLYPCRRWLTLYHFAGLIELLYALTFFTQPPPQFVALAAFFYAPALLPVSGVIFGACGLRLMPRKTTARQYELLILPFFYYFAVVTWYIFEGKATGWSGAVTTLAVYGFFALGGVQPPEDQPGARHDS